MYSNHTAAKKLIKNDNFTLYKNPYYETHEKFKEMDEKSKNARLAGEFKNSF